jgi:hypothetical protein
MIQLNRVDPDFAERPEPIGNSEPVEKFEIEWATVGFAKGGYPAGHWMPLDMTRSTDLEDCFNS